jgi:hypothetical protein
MMRKHKGVRITRVDIGVPIFRVMGDGRVTGGKPSRDFLWLIGETSPIKCSDLSEARATIDEFLTDCEKRGIPTKTAVEVLNG